jgi:hypothetical protein
MCLGTGPRSSINFYFDTKRFVDAPRSHWSLQVMTNEPRAPSAELHEIFSGIERP